VFSCETYQQMLSRTFTIYKGVLICLIYEGIDYRVKWKSLGFTMPFQSPDKWDNTIHFSNGLFDYGCNDQANSGRGINCSIVIVMKLYC
jgi:hypothetical protein